MKSHRTDGISFTFGLLFLMIAGWYVASRLVDLNLPMVGWSVAGALIVLGLLGLIGVLRSGRARDAALTSEDPQLVTAAAGRGEAGAVIAEPSGDVSGADRVTEGDRAPIAELLRAALEDGRLSFTEYNERLQLAFTAITYEELDRVVAGLEEPPPA